MKEKRNEPGADYFRDYRKAIGFSTQKSAKDFLGAKDIVPGIDYQYIDKLNDRLSQIIFKINDALYKPRSADSMKKFVEQSICRPYETIKQGALIPKLNNQGRRPEEVLFSWLRGFAIAEFFSPAISEIFGVGLSSILAVGDDDLTKVETFRRTPKADFEINKDGKKIRLEFQSGFQGVNDIKEHKVREAKNIYYEQGIDTICIHADLYNGQCAFINISRIEDSDLNWVTRQQMEGQSVFAIDQNYFKWRLLDQIPGINSLEIDF